MNMLYGKKELKRIELQRNVRSLKPTNRKEKLFKRRMLKRLIKKRPVFTKQDMIFFTILAFVTGLTFGLYLSSIFLIIIQ